MVKHSNFMQDLPDRNDTDIPPNVQWFLSLCETKVGFHPYAERGMGTEADKFCEGVVDYWWGYDDMVEPTFDQIFQTSPFDDEPWQGWPSQERIAYQKGAIIGYNLADKYKP